MTGDGGRTAGSPAGIEVQDIVKRYAGVTVLHGVTVAVRPGEVVGLVGHNGAGKSTLLRTIAGAIRPEEGTLTVDGQAHTFGSPADAIKAGVAAVYQELSLLPNLTVTQNVFLGDEQVRSGLLRRDSMRERARELVADFGLDVDVDRKVGDYPVATRQLLEIAIATHRNARYLLLDEPTTSLEGAQIERFLEKVRSLARDRGMGIVLVDHKLEELYAVVDPDGRARRRPGAHRRHGRRGRPRRRRHGDRRRGGAAGHRPGPHTPRRDGRGRPGGPRRDEPPHLDAARRHAGGTRRPRPGDLRARRLRAHGAAAHPGRARRRAVGVDHPQRPGVPAHATRGRRSGPGWCT